MSSKAELLRQLRDRIRKCKRCPDLLKPPVPPEGNPDATLMVVGRNPGATEYELRRPFVGRAGKLLDSELSRVGLSRAQLWISNAADCHGRGDRLPTAEEFELCAGWMRAQVWVIRPKLIVTLGKDATRTFLEGRWQWREVRGQVHRVPYPGRGSSRMTLNVFPATHPGQALRSGSGRDAMYEDFNDLADWVESELPGSIDRREGNPEED